jgi:hypothetical protein
MTSIFIVIFEIVFEGARMFMKISFAFFARP